jgi:hypothetical protein
MGRQHEHAGPQPKHRLELARSFGYVDGLTRESVTPELEHRARHEAHERVILSSFVEPALGFQPQPAADSGRHAFGDRQSFGQSERRVSSRRGVLRPLT